MTAALTITDGAPVIPDDIPRDVIYHTDGAPYMERYYLVRARTHQVRLHHLLTDDASRDLHDHPWDFTSLLLTGAYREHTPTDVIDYRAPCIITRHAEDLHRLELLDGPMWTLVTTGPIRRTWGFQTDVGWQRWTDYADAGSYDQ